MRTYCWTCGDPIEAGYDNALVIAFSTHVSEAHGESAEPGEIRRWIKDNGGEAVRGDSYLFLTRAMALAIAGLFVLLSLAGGGMMPLLLAGLALAVAFLAMALDPPG